MTGRQIQALLLIVYIWTHWLVIMTGSLGLVIAICRLYRTKGVAP